MNGLPSAAARCISSRASTTAGRAAPAGTGSPGDSWISTAGSHLARMAVISVGPSRVLMPVATAPNRLAAAYPTAKSIDDPR